MNKKLTWHNFLHEEKQKSYFIKILEIISIKRKLGINIYPAQKDIFNAFRLTELEKIKVVILGQDPYHQPNQAHGLAFSVLPGIAIPPSLLNIYKELKQDISGFIIPKHGYLKNWAQQGVFLLNTILTVEEGKPYSHFHLGWQRFTDKVIDIINKNCENIIFLLWGVHAKSKANMINTQKHYVFQSSHPSPLSANRGFFGCQHFSKTNLLLRDFNQPVINWQLL